MAKPKNDPKIPTVALGGKEWQVPKLAIRQLIEVRAPLIEINQRMIDAKGDAAATFSKLSGNDYQALVVMPVYHALTRAKPELTEDEFLDMEISDGELITAWFTVRQQSGIFGKPGESDAGEAKAARKSPTGT